MSESPEERARRIGVPLIPKIPPQPTPSQLNPIIGVCGECGRDVYMYEGYFCGRANCPIEAKVTI